MQQRIVNEKKFKVNPIIVNRQLIFLRVNPPIKPKDIKKFVKKDKYI